MERPDFIKIYITFSPQNSFWNSEVQAEAVIDSGSNVSAISPRIHKLLGPGLTSNKNTMLIKDAGDNQSVADQLVHLDFSLQDGTAGMFPFMVIKGLREDCLLCLNFLSFYCLCLDSKIV